MQLYYVSSLASKDKINYIINNSSSKPLQSIQRYHRLLCEGLVDNNIDVHTISALPISNKISSKKFWKYEKENINGVKYNYIPFINIPIFRQICLLFFTLLFVLKAVLFSKEKPVFICDILNTTISIITLFICKLFGCKCIGIVTDLPKDMNNSNKISVFLNEFFQKKYDSYIFITKYMNDVINKNNKPYIVIEGIVEEFSAEHEDTSEKYIMYAGGLYEKYGIKELIKGFQNANLKDIKLYIYGSGELEEYISNLNDENIKYFGTVTNDEILKKEKNAFLLINPRFSNEEYTKYSFPSKNIEYMSSGTPVLTTKLRGIPEEYFKYLFVIEHETEKGISKKLNEIFKISLDKLKEFGEKARKYVTQEKNKKVQASKIVDMLGNDKNITKNSKFLNIYGLLVMLFTILLSRNSLINTSILGIFNSTIILLILHVPLIYIFLKRKNYKNINLLFLLLFIWIIICIVFKKDFKGYNLSILCGIFLSYIYINIFDLKSILKNFCYIIFFLALYSILTEYFVYPLIQKIYGITKIQTSELIFSNSVGTPFLNMFFTFPVIISGYIRNFGIFTEPGYYQFYLILALLIISFNSKLFDKKTNIIITIVYLLTIISTFSTAGYMCLGIIIMYLYIKFIIFLKQKNDYQKIIITILITVLMFIFIVFIFLKNETLLNLLKMIFEKLTGNSDSTSTRLTGLFYTIKLMFKYPLFGANIYTVLNNNIIIANTNFAFGAIYGIFEFILLIILQYRFCDKISGKRKYLIICLIILLLSTNNHFFVSVHSFWQIMLIGLKKED